MPRYYALQHYTRFHSQNSIHSSLESSAKPFYTYCERETMHSDVLELCPSLPRRRWNLWSTAIAVVSVVIAGRGCPPQPAVWLSGMGVCVFGYILPTGPPSHRPTDIHLYATWTTTADMFPVPPSIYATFYFLASWVLIHTALRIHTNHRVLAIQNAQRP